MAGHSKWATTKRAKAVTDAKRGAVFTKLGNAITIAAREKGPDPEKNPSLRAMVEKARKANMPKDNIERAIKRGSGELGGDIVEELYYEGILPNNIQVVVKCLTDNKNRSASMVRHVLSKFGGSLSAVLWNFDLKGVIVFNKSEIEKTRFSLEDLELKLIDLEIEDLKVEDELIIVFSSLERFQNIKEFLEEQEIELESAEIEYVAKDKQDLSPEDEEKMDKFMEELEDIEDVNNYYFNF